MIACITSIYMYVSTFNLSINRRLAQILFLSQNLIKIIRHDSLSCLFGQPVIKKIKSLPLFNSKNDYPSCSRRGTEIILCSRVVCNVVKPVYKKDDASESNNYRGISLISLGSILLRSMILLRQRDAVDKIIVVVVAVVVE